MFFTLLGVISVYAQTRTVQGTVLDEQNMVLPGAYVVQKGTQNSITTDDEGKFILEIDEISDKVEVSFIGYTTQELDAIDTMTISLRPARNVIDEVVLVGYGEGNRKTTTTAVENVSMNQVANRSVKSANEYLQGQVSGVTVTNNGGDPTQSPSISIRGIGTLNGDSPLFVVDGVPYYGPPINPQDIKTMTVVKDASAAVYGARASGGVILIQTKGGKKGKTTIAVQVSSGVKQAKNLPTSLTAQEYLDIQNQATVLDKKTPDPIYDVNTPGNEGINETKTNWIDEVFQLGTFENYYISIASGSEHSRTFSSIGYIKEKGVLLNTEFEKINWRLNSTYTPNKKFKADFRINASYSDGKGANTSSAYSGIIFAATSYPRSLTVYDEKGDFRGIDIPGGSSAYGDLNNPVSLLLRNNASNPKIDLLSSANLKYEFIDGLSYNLNASGNFNFTDYKSFNPKVLEPGKPNSSNALSESSNKIIQILLENIVKYDQNFGDHNIKTLLGYTYQSRVGNSLSVRGQGFQREEKSLQYLSNAELIEKNGTSSSGYEDILVSYLGRMSYNYADKYLLSTLLRRDGSSRLYTDKYFDVFPSFSAGWNLAKEDFFDVDFISDLKIRGSWGQVGNINSLPYYGTKAVLSSENTLMGQNPTLLTGVVSTTLPNKDLK